jgi:hypothetical protein
MSALPIVDRVAINRANSQHSTGPRTAEGKSRSSQNALRHGLLSRTPVLPSEDQAAYEHHCRQFFDEYRPATPTESQLTQELADTAWRLNRIPALEANLLKRAGQAMEVDIAEATRTLSMLGLHGARLSRQFQKTLQQLREIQADRLARRERDLKDAAAVSEVHKHQGIPYDPAQDGFVFSRDEIDAFAQRHMRINTSRAFDYSRTYQARKLFGAMQAGK